MAGRAIRALDVAAGLCVEDAVSFSLPPDFVLLQVVPALDAGGVEQTTLDVARAVVEAGGRALVASAGGRMEAELAARGGELIRLPMDSKNPLQVLFANAGALEHLIKSQRVSLVHARSRMPAYSAWIAARRTKVPFVTTYHGVYNARSAPKRLYNRVMARGDMVIANSEFTRDHLLAEHHGIDPTRVVAIPRGIDLARFSPAAVSGDRLAAIRAAWGLETHDPRPVLLLAGRLTTWKGQALIIEAVRRLREDGGGQDLIVILAGDDQGRVGYRAELDAAIAAGGLADSVRIAGHCEDMPAAYLAADFALAPSLEPEAFGRTAVEPQAMGRPVLAADHGGARETVLDEVTGWRVRPGDPDAWAGALHQALSTPLQVRRAMGEAGVERARRLYSLEAMANATLGVYARLLAGSGS